jgi:large subunit ribosomal protein L13
MRSGATGLSSMPRTKPWDGSPAKSRCVVVNADRIRVTGRKASDKMYHHHTGYIGNLKSISFEKLQQKAPGRVLELAVKGMLPKNPLGRAMYRKLKIYAGPEHQHAAQQPKALDI